MTAPALVPGSHRAYILELEDRVVDLQMALDEARRKLQVRVDRELELERMVSALRTRLREAEQIAQLWGERLDVTTARLRELEAFLEAMERAHEEHLKTGDYRALGIATQDALLALAQPQEVRDRELSESEFAAEEATWD